MTSESGDVGEIRILQNRKNQNSQKIPRPQNPATSEKSSREVYILYAKRTREVGLPAHKMYTSRTLPEHFLHTTCTLPGIPILINILRRMLIKMGIPGSVHVVCRKCSGSVREVYILWAGSPTSRVRFAYKMYTSRDDFSDVAGF